MGHPFPQSQFGTPRKHGIWSSTRLTHSQPIRIKRTILGNTLRGFGIFRFPAGTLRRIGIRMTMNDNRRSHMKTNRTTGKPS